MYYFLLFLLCASSLFSEKKIYHGVTYTHLETEKPLSIHILEVDPTKVDIQSIRALNNGIGRETTSSMAIRTGAIAAINGGFFEIGGRYTGIPAMILKINECWFSDQRSKRAAIGWENTNYKVVLEEVDTKFWLTIGQKDYPIDRLNHPRGSLRNEGLNILFTYPFHRSTLTYPGGTEILIRRKQIIEIRSGLNDSNISENESVYSIDPSSKLDISNIKVGMPATLNLRFDSKQSFIDMDYIVGGSPLLVADGKENNDFDEFSKPFIEKENARTAIGINKDNKWIIVIVDGKQENSPGMAIKELATFMKNLGCNYAINLSGGSTSSLVIQHELINTPCGDEEENLGVGQEKGVSDAIVILPLGSS